MIYISIFEAPVEVMTASDVHGRGYQHAVLVRGSSSEFQAAALPSILAF
jgi:hypothetical protein